MRRCSRCILPETVPGIRFDDQGICNYCRQYERSFADWDLVKEKKRVEFEKLLEAARKLKRSYDCLIPLSGGKDSTYVLYLCSKVYGLNCLAVTFDNGYMSDRAKQNIDHALKVVGADHFLYRLNHRDTIRLFRTFLTKTGDFCNACMRGINFSIETAARRFKVPLIIKGSGKRVQYVSQVTAGISHSNSPFFFDRVIRNSEDERRFYHLGSTKLGLEVYKIAYIFKIPRSRMMRFFPQGIGIYDFIYKPYTEIIDIIQQEMNWQKPEDTFEHFDCALHSIPFYKDTLKIEGITTETFHHSGLIRQGLMTRGAALEIEEEQLKQKEPPAELKVFLRDVHLSFDEFTHYVKSADSAKFIPPFEKFFRKIYQKLYYKR